MTLTRQPSRITPAPPARQSTPAPPHGFATGSAWQRPGAHGGRNLSPEHPKNAHVRQGTVVSCLTAMVRPDPISPGKNPA
jgi:hypothetical protein